MATNNIANPTHHPGYYDDKQVLERRMRRIEGQVRGINKMIERDAYCIDILTQISAAKAALDKVSLELLRDHATHCMKDQNDTDNHADELVEVIKRLL